MPRSSGGSHTSGFPWKADSPRFVDDGQAHAEDVRDGHQNGPVECLGMTFPNDQARREYFLGKLKEKLKDPEFRKIEGFPIGEDEDILAMSDPPYYTACPNPFMDSFVKESNRTAPQLSITTGNHFQQTSAKGRRMACIRARLPHQGSAQGDHTLLAALYRSRRHRIGRILRQRYDRSGRSDVRSPLMQSFAGNSKRSDEPLITRHRSGDP